LTSAAGASFLVVGALLLLGQITPADLQGGGNPIGPIFASSFLWWLVWLAVAVVGIVFQVRTSRYYLFPQDLPTEEEEADGVEGVEGAEEEEETEETE
jgi:hypothetical protein